MEAYREENERLRERNRQLLAQIKVMQACSPALLQQKEHDIEVLKEQLEEAKKQKIEENDGKISALKEQLEEARKNQKLDQKKMIALLKQQKEQENLERELERAKEQLEISNAIQQSMEEEKAIMLRQIEERAEEKAKQRVAEYVALNQTFVDRLCVAKKQVAEYIVMLKKVEAEMQSLTSQLYQKDLQIELQRQRLLGMHKDTTASVLQKQMAEIQ